MPCRSTSALSDGMATSLGTVCIVMTTKRGRGVGSLRASLRWWQCPVALAIRAGFEKDQLLSPASGVIGAEPIADHALVKPSSRFMVAKAQTKGSRRGRESGNRAGDGSRRGRESGKRAGDGSRRGRESGKRAGDPGEAWQDGTMKGKEGPWVVSAGLRARTRSLSSPSSPSSLGLAAASLQRMRRRPWSRAYNCRCSRSPVRRSPVLRRLCL